jgi:Na+/melibiose symporter-like transporter
LAQLFILLEHFHGKPEEETTSLLVFYYVGSLGSVAVWIFLGTRFGKNRILCLALIGWPLTFLALVVHPWPTGLLCTVAFFMGAMFCGIYIMLGAITPEILDVDRSESGQRREGVFASVADLVWPAGLGVGFLLAGLVLHTIGYRGGTHPTDDLVTGLRISVASFPLALGWGALFAFSFFPISKDTHDELLRDHSSARPLSGSKRVTE